MPLIAMNREMGSLGKDVAKALGDALGLKVQHHEIIDHLANRARVRKSHVTSFLEGTRGIWERPSPSTTSSYASLPSTRSFRRPGATA